MSALKIKTKDFELDLIFDGKPVKGAEDMSDVFAVVCIAEMC